MWGREKVNIQVLTTAYSQLTLSKTLVGWAFNSIHNRNVGEGEGQHTSVDHSILTTYTIKNTCWVGV